MHSTFPASDLDITEFGTLVDDQPMTTSEKLGMGTSALVAVLAASGLLLALGSLAVLLGTGALKVWIAWMLGRG